MVDPIGTGFSHPLGDTPGRSFWGLDEDARSITQFIQRFLSQNNRWNSPKYLLGESYGTTRSAMLSAMLQGANIDLNGVVLVSTVLDFRTISFGPGDDLAVRDEPSLVRRGRVVPQGAAAAARRSSSRSSRRSSRSPPESTPPRSSPAAR